MLYLCYDTALNEEYTLIKLLQKYPGNISLFKGTDDEDIWDAAPYLFEVADNFYELRKDWLIQLDHCILFETSETREEVCRFLQYYMYTKKAGKIFYCRIWDARVLTKQLPGWDEKERVKFFDFFTAFYTEQEDQALLDKWQLGRFNKPVTTAVLKTDLLPVFETATTGVMATTGENRNITVAETVREENEAKHVKDTVPSKRRFFIE